MEAFKVRTCRDRTHGVGGQRGVGLPQREWIEVELLGGDMGGLVNIGL
jgi:hypothetical protein